MGCTNILKNAVGFIGVLIIIGICMTPIIRITVGIIFYAMVAAITEPIADAQISNLFFQIKKTFQLLLAMTTSISMMVIIGITIVIKLSGVI